MDQFKIEVENREYTINILDDKDQVLYEVHDNALLFVLGRNDDGQWEAASQVDEDFVKKIGAAIDEQEAIVK